MKMTPTINIQQEVQPHFKDVWIGKQPYNILYGGRNSFKSSVVALKLARLMIDQIVNGRKANIVVIRKVGNTIRDSVFQKIQWALKKFGMMGRFSATVSPFKITHKQTGSTFYFYGSDDFQKLKSNDINDIIAVWYEESAEFQSAEEFDQTNITFMRQKQKDVPHVKFYWSYNPPRNPYAWINGWVAEKRGDPNYLVDYSSYLDDELGLLKANGGQILDEINRIKDNDYDYYRYIYLGEAVGYDSNVYNIDLFKPLNELPSDDPLRYVAYSLDGGHSQSATTVSLYGITQKDNVILLDTLYYSPSGQTVKKSPSQLAKMVYEWIVKQNKDPRWGHVEVIKRTIDSAEAALKNQYAVDYGISWHPVAKKKKQEMIDYVHSLVASGRFYYLNTPANEIWYVQHRDYRYDDKTINTDDPKVIKEDDHTVDQTQYFVLDNAALLGLKY